MKKVTIATLLVFATVFIVSCNKDEKSENPNTSTFNTEKTTATFVVGNQLPNPYSVSNMQSAYDSLVGLGEITTTINIAPTHLYVQLFPTDSAQMNSILEDTNLSLFPYPLDHEISGTGTLEVHQGTTPEIYTVVPVGYTIPVNYQLLEECFIPDDYTNPDMATLELGSFVRTGNITANELSGSKSLWAHPTGAITVYNTDNSSYEGVKGIRVYTRKFVKIGHGYTNANGSYQISKPFLSDVHYALSFANRDGFKIWGNVGPITPALHYIGKHSKTGYNYAIAQNSQAWPWATINNGVCLYRDNLCSSFDVASTPSNLRLWYVDWNSSLGEASTPMFRHIAGYASVQVASILYLTGFISSINTAVIVGGALYCALMCCPDILITSSCATSTKKLRSHLFHELSHASHYSRVGREYWFDYVLQICANLGYGNGPNVTNGIIGVGEMWAYYFENKCINQLYGTNNSPYNGHWFRPQILQDVEDNVPIISPAGILNTMTVNVVDHNSFKTALINNYGNYNTINNCFANYGF